MKIPKRLAGNTLSKIFIKLGGGDISGIADGTITGAILEMNNALQKMVPVGYYFYWSPVDGDGTDLSTADKVHDYFGFGKWKQLKDRVLLGASDSYNVNSTGGEATHKLSVSEMPQHNHNIPNNRLILYTDNSKAISQTAVASGVTNTSGYISYKEEGGGAAHNNMQPYKAVYIWQRVK